jgi:hypothetical protein
MREPMVCARWSWKTCHRRATPIHSLKFRLSGNRREGQGRRCWRFAYRFARKYETLALGIYPDVSLERARSRREFARPLLAHGIDRSALKAALGKYTFAVTLREWERARGATSALSSRGQE